MVEGGDKILNPECLYWKLRYQPIKLNLIKIFEKTNNKLHRTSCGNFVAATPRELLWMSHMFLQIKFIHLPSLLTFQKK